MEENMKDLYDEIRSGTNVIDGNEYREIMRSIAKVASDLVVTTLGPYGSTTIIDDGSIGSYPSKDGWNCLSKLFFSDPLYNTAFGILRQVSFNSVSSVGDGTTTAMVGASAFLENYENTRKKMGNFRQVDFMNALLAMKDAIIYELRHSDALKEIAIDGDYEEIYKIAYISTNGNEEIAKIIQDIYRTTNNPNIHVGIDNGSKVTYNIDRGYKFDCGLLHHKAYVNSDDNTYQSPSPMDVIVFSGNVMFNQHHRIIEALNTLAGQRGRPILILAPYFDDLTRSVIDSAVMSAKQQGGVPMIMCGQVPGAMEFHRNVLADICMLTNASLMDDGKVQAINVMTHNAENPDEPWDDKVLELDIFKKFTNPTAIIESCIGRINKLVIDRQYAFIQDYETVADPQLYTATVDEAREAFEAISAKVEGTVNGHLDKDYMNAHMRYIKLIGKTGVIKIGGQSDIERRCTFDSVEDAVLACRASFSNGYIRGLNLETLDAIARVKVAAKNAYDEHTTICGLTRNQFSYVPVVLDLFENTFHTVSMAVLNNKYPEDIRHTVHVPDPEGIYRDMDITNKEILHLSIANRWGFNLVTDTFEPFDKLTVINPLDTDIQILSSMSSILSLIMTSSQVVSTAKHFDRKMTVRQSIDKEVAHKTEVYGAIADAILDRVVERKDELSGVFTSNWSEAELNSFDDCECGCCHGEDPRNYDCPNCGTDMSETCRDVAVMEHIVDGDVRMATLKCSVCGHIHQTKIYGKDFIDYVKVHRCEECDLDITKVITDRVKNYQTSEGDTADIIVKCPFCDAPPFKMTITNCKARPEFAEAEAHENEAIIHAYQMTHQDSNTSVQTPHYSCPLCGLEDDTIAQELKKYFDEHPEDDYCWYTCPACEKSFSYTRAMLGIASADEVDADSEDEDEGGELHCPVCGHDMTDSILDYMTTHPEDTVFNIPCDCCHSSINIDSCMQDDEDTSDGAPGTDTLIHDNT